eukprot:TRINITY_DN14933_c0_g1_i2.p1 TRINITY_DN14933_c0_g1~~TRINITY_DN14933_c0_g1_i2.p1  ORF type:complete len:125 (+),score=39.51 TRINITY_DN14933_c0_g1_i2:116-490(+)
MCIRDRVVPGIQTAENQTSMAKISEGPIIDNGHGLVLAGRYVIQVDQTLPDLSRPDAKACAVKDKQDPDADLFALLAPPETFVRHDMLGVLLEKPLKRLRGPQAAGVLYMDLSLIHISEPTRPY